MKRKRTGSVALLIFCSTLLFSADWETWRGPNDNWISSETDWNPKALENGANILWEAEVGKGHSIAAVHQGRLYTVGNRMITVGTDTLYEDDVFCLNTETGNLIWKYAYPSEFRAWTGPRCSPVVDADRLYILSSMGDLFCMNTENGQIRWKMNLVESGLSEANEWGFSGSPVVENDLLLLAAGKSGAALNKYTGQVVWKSEKTKQGLTTPVLFDHDGKRLALITAHHDLYAVDITQGDTVWSINWKTCNDPVIVDGAFYLTANHDRKNSMLIQKNGAKTDTLWESKIMLDWVFQNLLVKDGYSYGFGYIRRKQPLQCVDMKTGNLVWKEDLGQYGGMTGTINNKMIILTGQGELIIAEMSPEGFQAHSRAHVINLPDPGDLPAHLKADIWTLPVLANGRVYVRSNYGHLVCVDVSR